MSELGSRTTIRNPADSDEPQMVELLSRVFQRWPEFEIPVTDVEHLRWKMRSEPLAARHHWVTEIDDRIVVMLLRIVRRFRVRGRDYLAKDGVDAAVDPRYQGQRLYVAMVDVAKADGRDEEFHFGCSFTTNPRLRRRNLRFGTRSLANGIQVLEKPFHARAIVAKRRKKHPGRSPTWLAVLRIKLRTVSNRCGHPPYLDRTQFAGSFATLERFGDDIEAFFDDAARAFEFVIVRSKDYLNWRYCDSAAGRFTVRIAAQDDRILGYLVFKISEGTGYIADLLALPDRPDVVRSLIEDALRVFRGARVDSVTCWMISRHPYNRILRRYGFVDSKRDVGFEYRTITVDSGEVEFLDDPRARIHLTHGDSDWV